ncbi:MAG: hypothetical protein J4O05_04655 [Chloroflexi bacterium]|nr:hypothetical protein [Chloroflexota bacterium]
MTPKLLFGVLLVVAILFISRNVLFASGVPTGHDVWGHLARVWYMASTLADGNAPPDWFPHWYSGTALTQYYPPGSTFLLAPVQMLTGDVAATFRIYVGLAAILAGVSTYVVLLRWASSPWAALAGFFYAAAPQFNRIAYFEGNIPRILIYALMPIMLGLSLRLLETGSRKYFLLLTATVVVATHVHHQQTVTFLSMVGIGALVYVVRVESKIRLNALKTYAAWILGILVSAWFLIPGITRIDYPTVPNVSFFDQVLERDNLSHLFDPSRGTGNLVADPYIGLFLAFLALLVVVARPSRHYLALLLIALPAIVMSHGLQTPFFNYYPVPGTVPIRFVETATLALVFMLAGLDGALSALRSRFSRSAVPRRAYILVFIVVALLLTQDFSPYWSLAKLNNPSPVDKIVASLPPSVPGARLEVGLTGPSASTWSFASIEETGWRIPGGFSQETTPHQRTLFQFNTAIRNNQPQFVTRTYEMWNVRAFVGAADQSLLLEEFKNRGFTKFGENEGYEVLVSGEPSKPVMVFDRSMIAIGRGAPGIVEQFPWSSFSEAEYFDDLDFDYVDRFDVIFLWDFLWRDSRLVAENIRSWVASGKTVLIDMTRMPDPGIFDVSVVTINMPAEPLMFRGPEADFEFVKAYSVAWADGANEWRGVSYRGLDGVILNFEDSLGTIRPALGYKTIDEGKVYFLGLGWLIHASGKPDPVAVEFLDGFFDRASPVRSTYFPAVEISNFRPSSDHWGFDYSLKTPATVLVSETWSPHWRIKVDGVDIDVNQHENLILLDLPSGTHSVQIDYGSTPVQWASAAISLIVFFALAFLTIRWEKVSERVRTIDQAIWNSRWLKPVLQEEVARSIGGTQFPKVPGIVLQNGIRFDGAGTRRTHTVELEAGPKRMFLIGRTAVPASIVVRRAGQVVGQFDYSRPGEWFDLGELDDQVEFDVITAESHEWSLYLDTRPPEGPRAS